VGHGIWSEDRRGLRGMFLVGMVFMCNEKLIGGVVDYSIDLIG